MLIMGGQQAARHHIARAIGRRRLICTESVHSVESGLSILEWRRYDLVGIFLLQGLAQRLERTYVLRDAHVQLVLFGAECGDEVARIRRQLRQHGLPPPIVVPAEFEAYDESLFWRALAGHMVVPREAVGSERLTAGAVEQARRYLRPRGSRGDGGQAAADEAVEVLQFGGALGRVVEVVPREERWVFGG